eukprot:scaffold103289_cov31-Tisochrysis_lutea.AAC.2
MPARRAELLLGAVLMSAYTAAITVAGSRSSPSQFCISRTPIIRSSLAMATANWPDLTDEPVNYPKAQAARTVLEVCSTATLSAMSSAEEVNGIICTCLTAGAPSTNEPLRLIGSSDKLFVIDSDGCPIFELCSNSHVAGDIAKSRSVSFSAQSAAGSAQAGCSVTLIGQLSDCAALPEDLLKKMVKRTGLTAEHLVSRSWVKLEPEHVHVVDRLSATEAWVGTEDFAAAEPNPLAEDLGEVMQKLNVEFRHDLARLAAMLTDTNESETAGSQVWRHSFLLRGMCAQSDHLTPVPHVIGVVASQYA